jgi:nucleotide-binding universal stress UspA family protein
VTIVVAVAPEARSRAVVDLAGLLGRSGDEDLLLCAVVPAAWPPSLARVDAEYRVHLERSAHEAFEEARARLGDAVAVDELVHHARSAPAGLLEVAEGRDASLIVAGSSSAGVMGRVALGSVTDRLLHSSHVPLVLAPRGYRCRGTATVTRVTAAYGGSEEAEDLVVAAAGVAARVGASLRVVSLAVQPRAPYTSGVGREARGSMLREWAQEIEAAARLALARVSELPSVPPNLEAAIGHGETWDEALEDVEWHGGDVLVVGSSAMGPVARVFLGSHASKIVRHSPVPVAVVPRTAAVELAEEAEVAEPQRR